MKFTIVNMKNNLIFVEDKKKISLNGYAFIDNNGHCIIIIYGERRRDLFIEYLS